MRHHLVATRENRSSGFPNRSDTNRPAYSQRMARGLKFRIKKVEELYYPCSENKGADQLRSYCEADLRLCFRIGNHPVFSSAALKCQLASYYQRRLYLDHINIICKIHRPFHCFRSIAIFSLNSCAIVVPATGRGGVLV